MKNLCNLRVGRWAAIVVDADSVAGRTFGAAAPEDAIPAAIRRRMGRLERLAVRCTLGVLDKSGTTDELVFCSRHGNVETLASLLRSIAAREPLSPMAFSGSVHNAAPGLVGQICKERLGHTALAAGSETFGAGLIEVYARLATEECRDVTLTFADLRLPEPFLAFEDEDKPGVAIALRLTLGSDDSEAMLVAPGRTGVLELLDRLNAGDTQIAIGRLERPGTVL
jgi:Beta-ketoacyl synthase, N-terminal domain